MGGAEWLFARLPELNSVPGALLAALLIYLLSLAAGGLADAAILRGLRRPRRPRHAPPSD